MKQVVNIVAILLFFVSINGNNNLSAQPVVSGEQFQNDSSIIMGEQVDLFKPSVNVSMGTSFSSFGTGNSAVGTYIAPEVAVPVSKKLTMSVGMGYSMMFLNSSSEFGSQSNQCSYGSLFVSGTYQVNENLTVRGTAYKTFMLNPTTPGASINPQFFDFSNQGVKFDAEYKVNERFRIGVSVEYREQNYPTLYPGGNNNIIGSPFQTNSYTPGF